MEYAGVQSKEYADAMMKAGTPEKLDQEPIGTGPFYLVQYQKDAIIRYKAFPQFWGGKAKIDDLVFSITPDASVRWAKLQKGECHVMPYPNPADLDAIRKDPNVVVLEQPGPQRRLPRLQRHQEAVRRRARAQGRQHGDQQEGDHRRRVSDGGRGGEESDPADAVVVQQRDQGRSVRSGGREEAPRRSRLSERLHDRSVGDARAAAVQPQRAAHRRADAGGPREGRRDRRDQELRVGRVPQADAERRAPDGHAGLDRRQRRPRQLPQHAARVRRRQDERQQRLQVVLPAVRGPRAEGEDASPTRSSAPIST